MKVAILGAVHGTSESERLIFETYKAGVLEKLEDAEVVTPNKIFEHRHNFVSSHPNATENEILADMVQFDLAEVNSSDIVLADVSLRSTGMGIELAGLASKLTDKNSKPFKLFLFAKEGCLVSDMVKGSFPNTKIIVYSSAEDLAEILDKIL